VRETYGLMLDPVCGLVVAGLIAGRPPSFDPSLFSLSRSSAAQSATT
jgi:glycine/D-amino acid oxidase-like deaminating enzyme